MWLRFIPQQFNFFDFFDKQAASAISAAVFFKEIVTKRGVDDVSLRKMYDIEHEGDEITYSIIDHLNKTFITPFDREDIHTLTKSLDDITDMIRTIVNRMRVYQITDVDENLVEFSQVIDASVRSVSCAVKGLRNQKLSKDVLKCCLEITHYEKEGDAIRDRAIGQLFATNQPPISVIKLKEIYQDAETVLDICKQAAHVVEAILVKQV